MLVFIVFFFNVYIQKALKYDPLTTQGFIVCKSDDYLDVYDQNGKPIYHDKYKIPANKEVEILVSIENLPRGLIINVFTFPDGFTYSFSSYK